jgi:hypothetical protein
VKKQGFLRASGAFSFLSKEQTAARLDFSKKGYDAAAGEMTGKNGKFTQKTVYRPE